MSDITQYGNPLLELFSTWKGRDLGIQFNADGTPKLVNGKIVTNGAKVTSADIQEFITGLR
jgi:hypothetical protein